MTSLLGASPEQRFMRRVIPALFSWEMPLHILQFLKVIGTDDPHLRDTIPEFLDLAPCKGLESSTFKFLWLSLQILENEDLVQSLGLVPAKALFRDKALFYVRLRFIDLHGRPCDKADVRDYEEALKTANDDNFQLLVNIYALVYHALTTDLSNRDKADSASHRNKVVKYLQGIARPTPRKKKGNSPRDGKGNGKPKKAGKGNGNPKKAKGTNKTPETQEGDSKKDKEASESSNTQELEDDSNSGQTSKDAAAGKENPLSGTKRNGEALESEDHGAEAAKKPKVNDEAHNKNDGQIMLDVTGQSKDKLLKAATLELPLGTLNSLQMPSAEDMSHQWELLMKRTWKNARDSFSAKSGSDSKCMPLLNKGCGGVWPGAEENKMVALRVKAAMSFFSCKTCCMLYLAATSGKYHENKQRAVEVTIGSMSSRNLKQPEPIAGVSDFLTFVGTCHPSFDSFILGLHFAGDGDGTLPCGQIVGTPGHLSPVISSPLNVVRNASSVNFWRHVSSSEHPANESLQLHLLCLQNYGKHETILVDRPCGLPWSVMSFIPIKHWDEVLQDLYQVTKASMLEPFHQSLYKLYLEHFKCCADELGKVRRYLSSPLLMAMTHEDLKKFKKVKWSAIWDKKEEHDWPKEETDFMNKCMECFEHLAKGTPAKEGKKKHPTPQQPPIQPAAGEKKTGLIETEDASKTVPPTPETSAKGPGEPAKENDVPASGTAPTTPKTTAKGPDRAGEIPSGSVSPRGQQRAAPKPSSSTSATTATRKRPKGSGSSSAKRRKDGSHKKKKKPREKNDLA